MIVFYNIVLLPEIDASATFQPEKIKIYCQKRIKPAYLESEK